MGIDMMILSQNCDMKAVYSTKNPDIVIWLDINRDIDSNSNVY